MYPMKLKPAVSSTLWGGRRLIDEYGVVTDKENAAEAWVLSCHPNGCAEIINGEYAGRTLKSVYDEDRSICGVNGARFGEFPILIKFIDARDNLSIQVHPDEAYARRVEHGAGKTECWYILDCDDDACLILGFKEAIDKDTFKQSIENNTLLDYVQNVKVKKGDFFFIEAGTLHAICKGVLLAEVQQNSDTTYRVYDYNRQTADGKPRELHISKAVDVTSTVPFNFDKKCGTCKAEVLDNNKILLTSCDLFSVFKVEVQGNYVSQSDGDSFVSLLALEGEGTLECCGEALLFIKGDSVFIPAGAGEFKITGHLEVLETRI